MLSPNISPLSTLPGQTSHMRSPHMTPKGSCAGPSRGFHDPSRCIIEAGRLRFNTNLYIYEILQPPISFLSIGVSKSLRFTGD